MIKYLLKFIPSDKTHNMRLLLKKDAVWNWNNGIQRIGRNQEIIEGSPFTKIL